MTINDQQLDAIEARAAGLYEYATGLDKAWQDEADQLAGTDVPALVAEVRRLRARVTELETAMEQIRHLHKDSPMGPCPVCIDADAIAAGGDGLMPYPCPTARLAGAQDCEPLHVRAARYATAGDEMAASLAREGLDDAEIAEVHARAAARSAAV